MEKWIKKDKSSFIFFIFIFISIFYTVSYISTYLSKQGDKKIEKKNEPIIKTSVDSDYIDRAIVGEDLLGKAEISFSGSTPGREKNIELGIAKINGKVILPGEEFSFKDTLGTTTPEMGYGFEKQFLNGEVTKGIGGGLCQVSSTLFRSILSAGLPVTQRANHTYTVSYYDVGLDATFSDPGPDLKFVNDTKNPIIIKGKTEDKKAVFEIYGTNDGRVASTSEAEITDIVDILPTRYAYVPELEEWQTKCINTPQIGYTAKVIYGVLYRDGTYKSQDFVSKYKPLQRVCFIVGDEIKTFDINKIISRK